MYYLYYFYTFLVVVKSYEDGLGRFFVVPVMAFGVAEGFPPGRPPAPEIPRSPAGLPKTETFKNGANGLLGGASSLSSVAKGLPAADSGLSGAGKRLPSGSSGLQDAAKKFHGGASGLRNSTKILSGASGLTNPAKGLPAGGSGISDLSGVVNELPGGASGLQDTVKGLPDMAKSGNLSHVTSLTKGLTEGCIHNKIITADDISAEWVDNFGHLGLYNRISYKMYGWKTSLPSAPKPNRKAKHTKCWDVQMKTPIGLLSAGNKTRTTCTFEDNVAREKCALSTTSLDFLGAFEHWGDFDIIKYKRHPSDKNKSYMLVYVCLLGRDNYFLTLTPSNFDTPIDPEMKSEVLAEMTKLGFEEKKIFYDGTDDLAIQKVTMGECPPEGILDALPLGGVSESLEPLERALS